MDRTPAPGELYRHFKGKLYQVIAVAEHTETGERLVVYQALYGDYKVYARPLAMFAEETDREKYPWADQKYRFEKVDRSGLCAGPGTGETGGGKQEESGEPEREETQGKLNPLLLRFVETEDFGVKAELLWAMKGKVSQEETDILCESLDLPKGTGDMEDQMRSIEHYLEMRRKFDGGRLR